MPDVFTKAKRSLVMSKIRSSGNHETELEMIRVFRQYGITGWRRGQRIIVAVGNERVRVQPDFTFRSRSIVVFVDGEFWHGHPTLGNIPKTRRAWWSAKIEGNKRRDRLQNRVLRNSGWTVVRIWQSELKYPAVVRKLRLSGLLPR